MIRCPVMHVVLLPFGSAGDVFPFLWLGRQLKAHGHEVTVIVASVFEEIVRKAGLEVVTVGTQADFDRFIKDPRVWKLYQGTKMVFELAAESTGLIYEQIDFLIKKGQRPDLLMAACTVFGARLAREKHGIPLVTVHVQPAVMISAYEMPVLLPGMQHLRPGVQKKTGADAESGGRVRWTTDPGCMCSPGGAAAKKCVVGLGEFPGWCGGPVPALVRAAAAGLAR
jgi:UDP:flavonoid glycosyltransferase YjiC (YdhE family)